MLWRVHLLIPSNVQIGPTNDNTCMERTFGGRQQGRLLGLEQRLNCSSNCSANLMAAESEFCTLAYLYQPSEASFSMVSCGLSSKGFETKFKSGVKLDLVLC